MIRVNLMNNRREPIDGLEAAIAATGASAFISRREIVLGALFLALGAGILYLDFVAAGDSDGATTFVAAASDEFGPRPVEQPEAGTGLARIETIPAEAARTEQTARLEAAVAQPSGGTESVQRPDIVAAPRVEAPASSEPDREPAAAAAHVDPLPRASSLNRSERARPAANAIGPEPPSRRASAQVAGELSAVDVSRRGAALEILATIGTQPAYQMFRLNSPSRVVVDLSGVTLALPASQRQVAPSHPLVERIRIAQFQVSPPKVRMVLDVRDFPDVSITSVPSGLAMRVAAPAP